jgi:hypothetical protein
MTEMVNGEGQSFSNSSAGAPVSTPSSAPSQAPAEERTFRQSEVNDLVGRAKHEAVERFRRDSAMSSHQPSGQQQNYGSQIPQGNQPPYQAPQPQHQGMSEQEYRRIAAEEAQRSRQDWMKEAQRQSEEQDAQRTAQEFLTRLEPGKSKYDDFDKRVKEAGFGYFPNIVQLANMVDNTDEVVYELACNPTKIASIQNLVDIALRNGAPPTLALNEMKRISDSIRENLKAKNFKSPNEPLGQLRPSNAGTDNKGALTSADYRKRYKV